MRKRRFITGPKRKMTWEWGGLFGLAPGLAEDDIVATWARVPAGYVDNDNSAGIPVQIEPDATLIRSRVNVTVGSNNGGAQQQYPWIIAVGLIAWDGTSDDTADIGALPHPYYDQELDWVWRAELPSVVQNIAVASNTADRDAYESRAMRKLSNGTGLLLCFAFADPGQLPLILELDFAINARMLFKLP